MQKKAENIIANLRAHIARSEALLVERKGLLELIFLGMIAQEHVLLIGPPGVGKSAAARQAAKNAGGRYFEYLIGRFTEPAEVFGPLDINALRDGQLRPDVSGMLPEADIAFLDEIFLGSTAILNTLLGILNERQYRRGHFHTQVPLRCCIAASNRLPEDPALQAFADRFLLTHFIDPVSDHALDALLQTGIKAEHMAEEEAPSLSIADMDALAELAKSVSLETVRPFYTHILRKLRNRGVSLSDRRIAKGQKFIAAADEDFAAKRLPLIALPLLHRLLEDEALYGSDKTRRDAGLSLAEASGQLALRVDIRRLNRVNVEAAPAPLKRISLNAASNLTPVRDAIGVPGNRLLIAYETGALHLTTMDGRRLWSDHIHNVRGFAWIGSGNAIIVIRDEIEGSALSLLNLDDRTHRDIGFFDVRDFHREASEIGWMSFGDGRVSMLDTSSLIAAAKNGGGTLEHHWTVPITEPGRICALLDRPDQTSFLYHRQAGGLVEHWALEKSTLKVSCSFLTLTGKLRHEIQTFGWTGTMNIHAFSEDHTQMERGSGSLIAYSMQVERRLIIPSISI